MSTLRKIILYQLYSVVLLPMSDMGNSFHAQHGDDTYIYIQYQP
jgi:hypothetical protein